MQRRVFTGAAAAAALAGHQHVADLVVAVDEVMQPLGIAGLALCDVRFPQKATELLQAANLGDGSGADVTACRHYVRFTTGSGHRLARVDVVPVDLTVGRPAQDSAAGHLGAVVAADRLGR